MSPPRPPIRSAEVVLPCTDLAATLAFFTERLGFRLETISPAEEPSVAVIAGHGTRLRLQRGAPGGAGTLRLTLDDPTAVPDGGRVLEAPNGTRIELVSSAPELVVPPLEATFVLSRRRDARWRSGRAGMLYRDLVPDRQGGRFVASHIQIPGGGPVADTVHYHRVRFQLIFCTRGWVRLVYEDQGPPFVLAAGDCVLQPPEIRHRVLASSPGLEVVEVGCPAGHDTCVDHELELPTPHVRPERAFEGQRFVRDRARDARWGPWRLEGYEARDTGIAAATGGVVGARVVRACAPVEVAARGAYRPDAELFFLFVVEGRVTLEHEGCTTALGAGDGLVIPAGSPFTLGEASPELELLEVVSPVDAPPGA